VNRPSLTDRLAIGRVEDLVEVGFLQLRRDIGQGLNGEGTEPVATRQTAVEQLDKVRR